MPDSQPISDRLRNIKKEVLSDQWYTLYRYQLEYRRSDGRWENQQREVFDRGNGAAVLLYDPDRMMILLTRQFRLPTYLNDNPEGQLTEVCAGLLDGDSPEETIRREILEETGYEVAQVEKVLEAYSSPGAVTELLHYYLAAYHPGMKKTAGGGLASETEDITVFEVSYDEVLKMVRGGRIRDAKTLVLLQYAALFGPLNTRREPI